MTATPFRLLAATSLALLLSGCPQPQASAPASTATPEEGAELFKKYCSACHGPDAKGLPNLGKDLHKNEFVKGKSEAELLAFVKVGRAVDDPLNTTKIPMPPKGGNPALKDEEINAITVWIRTLQ